MQKLKDIIRRGLIYETGILIAFYLFSFVLPMEQPGISARYFFLILGFSMIFSLAQEIFSIKKLHTFARYALHFAALLASFIFIYCFAGNYADRGPSSFFVAIVLFSLGYVVIAALCALVQSKVKAKKQKAAPSAYQKIYK
jgi:hypothetical protein